MKNKNKVNVLGVEYEIEYIDLGDLESDGLCDYTLRKIILRKDNQNELGDFERHMRKVLRHEIIHAFMSESGLQSCWRHSEEYGQDESYVDWFAIQFPKIHKVFEELNILD